MARRWMGASPIRASSTSWRRPSARRRLRLCATITPSRSPAGPRPPLLLMPAWEASAPGAAGGGTPSRRQDRSRSFPTTSARAKPAVFGTYLLLLGRDRRDAGGDGRHPAHRLAHGRARRALASRYSVAPRCLAPAAWSAPARWRPSSSRAHASVRPIRQVAIWNRSPDRARALAATLAPTGLDDQPSPAT